MLAVAGTGFHFYYSLLESEWLRATVAAAAKLKGIKSYHYSSALDPGHK